MAELDPDARLVVTEGGEGARVRGLRPGHRVASRCARRCRGATARHLLTIRTVEDSERCVPEREPGDQAIVVGSGFIGCEAAASLAMRGCRVTLVTRRRVPHAARLGEEVGEPRRLAPRGGRDLLLGRRSTAIEPGTADVSLGGDERIAAT